MKIQDKKITNSGMKIIGLSKKYSKYIGFFLTLIFLVTFLPSVSLADEYVYDSKFGSVGSGDGQFNDPRTIAIDPSGNIYIGDGGNNRVQKFNSSGVYQSQLGTGSSGSADGQFNGVWGVATDSSGNIYVTEIYNDRVQKFNSSGVYQSKFGSTGSGDGQFNDPKGIAVDSSGNIYVVDSGNNRIQKFNSSGVYQSKFGTAGSGDGQFSELLDITIDSSDNIYVTEDYSNMRVQKFNSSGVFQLKFGSGGAANGQFWYPSGIGVNSDGKIYVVDSGNTQHRVQIFSSSGNYESYFGSAGSGNGQLAYPQGLAIDDENNVFIVDHGNDRVQKFVFVPTTIPTVTSDGAPVVTSVAAELHGSITSTGAETGAGTSYGFKYSINSDLSSATTESKGTYGSAYSNYTSTIYGLACSTIYYYTAYASNSAGTSANDIDSFETTECEPPYADSVSVSGSTAVGSTLTGTYTYNDPEGDSEGTSTFQWYRDDVAISGVTSQTYTTTSGDVGKNIKFEVTPIAQTAPFTGEPVKSDPVVPHITHTLTVNSLLDDGDGTCTSKCTFRDAIANAVDGDTVEFQDGLTGTIVLTGSERIEIDYGISIIGPGSDVITIDFNDDTSTYIDLEIENTTINISGLTFTNAPDYVLYYGGDGSTYNISDSVFTNNTDYEPIYAEYGDWNFDNVIFSNNETCDYGGAIAFFGDGDLTITDSTFSNNSSCYYGGAIYLDFYGNLTITNSTFSGNHSDDYGGAIYAYGDNSSDYGMTVTSSTFSENSTDGDDGAAIYVDDGTDFYLTIVNSTFYNNTSGDGGYGTIYYYEDGTVTITNSTFYDDINSSDYFLYSYTEPILNNNIFYSQNSYVCYESGHNTGGHNIESGTSCGFEGEGDLSSTDPLLDTVNGLADNGGDVETIALLTGSPAINAGDDESAPDTDARGWDRVGVSDIGAYEFGAVAPSVPDSTPTPTPTPSNGSVVGGSFSFSSLPNYVKPRPQIIYPDGHIVYLDEKAGAPVVPTIPTFPSISQIALPSFPTTITLGKSNTAVKTLQQILNSLGYTVAKTGAGSPGKETTTFGSLTLKALQKFQCDTLKVCSGTPGSTGYGRVGPRTLGEINKLLR